MCVIKLVPIYGNQFPSFLGMTYLKVVFHCLLMRVLWDFVAFPKLSQNFVAFLGGRTENQILWLCSPMAKPLKATVKYIYQSLSCNNTSGLIFVLLHMENMPGDVTSFYKFPCRMMPHHQALEYKCLLAHGNYLSYIAKNWKPVNYGVGPVIITIPNCLNYEHYCDKFCIMLPTPYHKFYIIVLQAVSYNKGR